MNEAQLKLIAELTTLTHMICVAQYMNNQSMWEIALFADGSGNLKDDRNNLIIEFENVTELVDKISVYISAIGEI